MTLDRRDFLRISAAYLAGAAVQTPRSAIAAPAGTGGTLTYAVQQDPPVLVSLLDTNTVIRNISAKISEGLLRYNARFEPQPLLAVQWDISADGLRYTFRLRPNVRWHDGQPFSSADVRFSILTQQRLGPRGRITLANVVQVETPDPPTTIIVLNTPTPYLIKAPSSAELPIVPKHRYDKSNPLASPNQNAPVGTGPFVFDKWVQGSYISLRRTSDYWRAVAPIPTMPI